MKMKKKLLAALLASALAAGMLPTSACAVSSAYTSSNATLISFTDSAVTADGKYSGYEIEGTDVSITAAGTYVFSGDCDDGSITVKKGVTGVTLVLNGLTLTNADSAAITLNKTAEAALIAAAGSENTVADTAGANDENAAVKVKSGASLSLSGTGTLTACGNVKNGIKGASDAVITVDEMTLNIEASDDGVNAANSELGEHSDKFAINIAGGDLYIDAGSDGLDSNNDISITGGRVEVYGADAMMDAAIDYDGTFTLSGGTLFGAGMEPGAGTQAYIAVGETSPSGGKGGHGGMGGGANGGQDMTPPNDAGGTAGTANGNPRTPPANADGSTTPPSGDQNGQQSGARPEKTSGGNGQQGGKPTNRESALGIKKGSVITVQDADGRTLYTATALGSMSSVIFSSSDIKEGETYTVLVDGASVGTATAKLGTSSSSSGSLVPDQNGGQPGGVSGFQDVGQNDWFASAVRYVTGKSLMNGKSTTAFAPNENMSRAMLATVLYRMSGETAEADSSFRDVSSSAYYAAAVSWASSEGIVNGTGADAFSPNASITREQLAAMLYRYAGEPSVSADLSAYTDTVDISPYASKAVEWCVAKGILSGKSATRLAPQDTATRAECAAMLQRFAAL